MLDGIGFAAAIVYIWSRESGSVRRMLRRLSRGQRWRAACLLVLAYVFTVLAPAAANAFAPSPPPLAHHTGKRVIAQHHAALNNAHAHADGSEHAHHQDQAQSPDQSSDQVGGELQCCGLACISALPAAPLDVAVPVVPKSVRLEASYVDVVGGAPPRLYRPPIS